MLYSLLSVVLLQGAFGCSSSPGRSEGLDPPTGGGSGGSSTGGFGALPGTRATGTDANSAGGSDVTGGASINPSGETGGVPEQPGGSPSAGGASGGSTGGSGSGSGGISNETGTDPGDTGGEPSGSGGISNGTGGGLGDAGGEPSGSGGNPSTNAPTATEAAAAMGRGVNLGQMFESTQHSRTLAAASAKIDAYYARGFRNVRIPITWTEPVGGDLLVDDPAVGTVNRSHARLAVIESVVDYALSKADLYVIINAHHEVTLKTESRGAVLEQLWKDIADVFRDKNHRLLFEILNEPHTADGSAMPAADLRSMTGLAYDQIRAVDSERIVLFGGNQWFGAHEVPAVWTDLDEVGGGSDPYLMVTFHHYDPWTFCGDSQGTYDDAWTDANQSDPMAQMATWAGTVGQGMPVYIGEWGVGWGSRYDEMTCNNIRQWYTRFDSVHAAQHDQRTAVWDDGGWFKIFDHGTNTFDNNLIDCIEGSCSWDGDERFNDGCL